jgi:twinkle protein
MKTQCPNCAEQGKDTSKNGLHVYADGSTYCFKCTTYTPPNNERKIMSKLTVDQVKTYPVGTDPSRGLDKAIEELYGVRHSVNGETGEPETIYYPYYDGKNVVGYKVRKLPKDFDAAVGKIGGELFGQQLSSATTSYCILTEGEEDAMAAKQMIGGAKVDVFSLPNGAKGVKSIHKHYDLFDGYKRVYLCFDADADGAECTQEHGDWLSTITETRWIDLDPAIGKDASDYLAKGKAAEFRQAIKDAQVYEPEGVVNGTDIPIEDLRQPMPEGYVIPFPGLHEKLHGLRKGEIVTVCAGSGIGKSTMVREMTLSLIEQGLSVANIALEDQMSVAAQALIALDMSIPLPIFRMKLPPLAEMQPSYDKVVANGNTFFYKHFAGITSDSLMNKLKYYASSKKVDFIILDHLSLVISASQTNNERQAIDQLMTQLAKLVVETGVGLIQIVHLKRTNGDKSYAHGGEVELTDLRGSAALEQLSWAVVGLERDQQGDDRDFSKVRVLKNRTWGFTGLADHLKFDATTGRMFSVAKESDDVDREEEDEE